MNPAGRMRTCGACPVCGGEAEPLLVLPGQPIYQHPVPADAVVPAPYAVDLRWDACVRCAHAWQPAFDAALLENIYRSHYYTPAPGGMAVQFRDAFLAAVDDFGLLADVRVLLEIGASDGGLLAELRDRTGAACAYAFEPDRENAAVARERGLDVRERFFGRTVATEALEPADFIYARHVIEHIFDFNDFFAGLAAAAGEDAALVFETPSLDRHVEQGTFHPFHVEHVHVFSLRSLETLALAHGWRLRDARVTADGNLIAAFRRGAARADGAPASAPRPAFDGLQDAYDRHREAIRQRLGDRRLVFWGAGSAGVVLANLLGREPEWWTDGNPNKVGKKFVGLEARVLEPADALGRARSASGDRPALVISSSFAREIVPRVRALGWDGELFDLNGTRL